MEIYLELRKRKEHDDREAKYRRLELDSISIQVILSTS